MMMIEHPIGISPRAVQERMNSPLELHEVRLRGLQGGLLLACPGFSEG
jgi:hypothetical protein